MAKRQTAQEFIQSSFSPSVAVLCSPKADNFVSKNNLSFVEILQPFTILDEELNIRDPTGTLTKIRNFKLNIRDVNWKPLQPTEARKQLNNAVINNYHDKTVPVEIGNCKFDIPQSTLWFDAWRETYFDVQFPSDHEYTKHFVGCIMVACSSDENIIDTFKSLQQQLDTLQNLQPPKLPKWFNNDILKSYVFLYDPAHNLQKAREKFTAMSEMYTTINCFWIQLNSKKITDTDLVEDIWAPFIKRSQTQNDLQAYVPVEPAYVTTTATSPGVQEEYTPTISPEGHHPLTIESDVYDNANSLQTDSLTGSVESISIDRKISDTTHEVHGAALAAEDVETLKTFIYDYVTSGLIRYFEKQIMLLSDLVANRKGVSRSLLSATKRWFGSGKGATVYNYSPDCAELQLRRLGDLLFMSCQWRRAFEAYHTAKREFSADAAWLSYAGALEMAALSAFMSGDASTKTHAYIAESITVYLDTCRMVQYAVRATLLSVLCLTNCGMHGEAAKQLIRMTSEDSDLRSAMLLEQAALAFLNGPGPKAMCRKYAFHMVLAGHRFSKAGQKKHAYRCYRQAFQIYKHSGWRLSTDHVQFALGRLASGLRHMKDAVRWLTGPLEPLSSQPAEQQHSFLREYMLAHQQWIEISEDKSQLSILPLPLISGEWTAVLCVGIPPLALPRRVAATSLSLSQPLQSERLWHRLEEMVLQAAQGGVPMIFKPTINLHNSCTDNSRNPIVPQGEPVQISVSVNNPLKISLSILDVELLWHFLPSAANEDVKEPLRNEPIVAMKDQLKTNIISGHKIKSITLEGESEKNIVFSITPLQVGELHLQGIAYKLCNGSTGEHGNKIVISGKQILNIPKKPKSNKDDDKRLQIKVVPCAPCLQMTFSEISPEVINGELLMIDVEFRNAGPVDLTNLYIAFSNPECISLATTNDEVDNFKALYEEKYQPPSENTEERSVRAASWRSTCARAVHNVSPSLASGAVLRRQLRLRAAVPTLHILAYYDAPNTQHRLLRHTFNFNVLDVVKVVAVPRRYLRLNEDKTAQEMMCLAVEVQNDKSVRDTQTTLEILEASLLSRQWKLMDFIMSRDKSDALILHEKLHLVLRANRIKKILADGFVDWTSVKINQKHPESLPNINTAPYSKFVVDYKTSLVENGDTSWSQDKEQKSNGLIRSTLVVRWKIHIVDKSENRTAIGQTYVWLECFSSNQSNVNANILRNEITSLNFEENDNDDSPNLKHNQKKDGIVIFKIEHPHSVTHNFSKQKLCVVPVFIHFVNCYGIPVKAFMNMSTKGDEEIGWAGCLSSVGGEVGASASLGPFESCRVPLRALLAAPGTYELAAAAKLICQLDQCEPAMQICNNSSILVVKDVTT